MTDDVVEQVARAIWDAENRLHPDWVRPLWDSEIDMPERDEYRTVARAALKSAVEPVINEAIETLSDALGWTDGTCDENGCWHDRAHEALVALRALRPKEEDRD